MRLGEGRLEVVEADAAVQRQATDRPAILYVDAELRVHAVFARDRRRAHRDLVGHAVLEPVARGRVDVALEKFLHAPSIQEADLERVGPGDVRERRPGFPDIGRVHHREDEEGAVLHAGTAIQQTRDRPTLLRHGDERPPHVVGILTPRGVVQVLAVRRQARIEEDLVRQRRRPPDGDHLAAIQRELADGFRGGGGIADRVVPRLVVVIEAELVLRSGLPGETPADAGLNGEVVRLLAGIGRVGPPGGVARVQVVVQPGEVVLGDLPARRRIEPQAVGLDRPASRPADVVQPLHLVRSAQSAGLQILAVVVALERIVHAGPEERTAERVAAFLRNVIDAHAAERQFGVTGRVVHHDLLRASLIRKQVGERARRADVADREAVLHDAGIAASSAVNRETGVVAKIVGTADVLGACHHSRNQHGQALVTASRRNRVDDLLLHHPLLLRTLHVDDRRLARHRDRLGHRADTHVRVHGGRERARQLDPFTLHRRKPLQGEGDAVGARAQIDDPVLPGPVGDHGANLFNQRWTGRRDGDAGKDRTGRVLDDAGDRGLSERECGRHQQPPAGREDQSQSTHACTPCSWCPAMPRRALCFAQS